MPFTIPLSVTIPAATLEKDAVRSAVVKLPGPCVLDRYVAHVPSGHFALVPWWLEMDRAQVLPDAQTGDGEIRLDNVSALDLMAAPIFVPRTTELQLVGYNEDADDPHTVRGLAIGRYRTEVPEAELRRLGGR